MMLSYWKLFLTVAIIGGLGNSGCSDSRIDEPAEYAAHINDAASGLTVRQAAAGVELSMQYLPPQYLALKDRENSTESYVKRLEGYRNSMTFVLKLSPISGNQDVITRDMEGYDDYRQRIALLNFSVKEYARLDLADTTLVPVLGTMENTYSLIPDRKLLLVFDADPTVLLAGKESFHVVFADPVFGTGINRFAFRVADILNAPTSGDKDI